MELIELDNTILTTMSTNAFELLNSHTTSFPNLVVVVLDEDFMNPTLFEMKIEDLEYLCD